MSPGKEYEPGGATGLGAGEGVVQRDLGGARAVGSRSPEPRKPRSRVGGGVVGVARSCGPRGRGLGLGKLRREWRGGRDDGGGGACVCSGRGPPQRGSAGQESSASGCRGASTASLTAPAPVPATLATSRRRRGLHRSPSPVPCLGARIWGPSGLQSLRRPHLARIWNRLAGRAGARAQSGPATPGALPGAGASPGGAGPGP